MNYLRAPDTVSWEITELCNLRCAHCSNAVDGAAYQMQLDECYRVIDILAEHKVLRLNIEGGEPFVREDLIDILHYANKRRFQPKIDTNGTLIDMTRASDLSKCKIRGVQVSMDGPTAQSYAQVRKSVSAYEHALRGIECIKRVGIKISISMVLMKGNIQYIPEFLKLAEYMCVDSVRFVDFIPTGRGQLNACADAYELRAAYQVINEYIHKSEHIPVIVPTKITGLLNNTTQPTTVLHMLNPNCYLACEAGTVLMHIRSNGDVTPCVYFRETEFVCGNILKDDFVSIWEYSRCMNVFRNLGKLPDKCSDCPNIPQCMGGCRAYSYYKTSKKSLLEFDERCWRN